MSSLPPAVAILQLPFPSTRAPHDKVAAYYRSYQRRFAGDFPGFALPEGALWEMPLWVAHLAGMLEQVGRRPVLVDLSRCEATVEACREGALSGTHPGQVVLLSPLAQNMNLAAATSRGLRADGRVTVIGGNMAAVASPGDATHVHVGQLTTEALAALVRGDAAPREEVPLMARRGPSLTVVPRYDLLTAYHRQVPLLRINASHGCLQACQFCGDSWSRQLRVVAPAVLEAEIQQLEKYFPETKLIYVGDKIFGQAPEAVRNLADLFGRHPGYRLIVQTHVTFVTDRLIDQMKRLNVVAVEMGLESADAEMLRAAHKATFGEEEYLRRVGRLHDAGFRVMLNVLGGLPGEREASHRRTLGFIRAAGQDVWLYNLYNFVPYPLTPYFRELRPRIFDWDFSHWREDMPVVYRPDHLSVEESWHMFLEKIAFAQEAIQRPSWGGDPRLPEEASA